jgi:2-keto-4-pentenoate hydratase/2-oxohepta-3-ene-1,7-dioic acid hydratase in catechol pathway
VRLCTFDRNGTAHAGVVSGRDILDLTGLAGRRPGLPGTVLEWVQRGPEAWAELRDLAAERHLPELLVPLATTELRAPIPILPRNVICVGANYAEHVYESERVVGSLDLPESPVYFTKDVRSICGPGDAIVVDPGTTSQLDWEVELAVVIGSAARNLDPADALAHVWGYAVLNDVSARDLQLTGSQWWRGKSLERSSPLGPFLVTADEVPDPQRLELRCWVDGVLKQHGSTADMVHSVASVIADLRRTLTLLPGDVISTGTPAGVGLARTPQEWLIDGNSLESEIAGLGRQRNSVVNMQEATHG